MIRFLTIARHATNGFLCVQHCPSIVETDKQHVPQQTGVFQGRRCECVASSKSKIQLNLQYDYCTQHFKNNHTARSHKDWDDFWWSWTESHWIMTVDSELSLDHRFWIAIWAVAWLAFRYAEGFHLAWKWFFLDMHGVEVLEWPYTNH